MGYQATIKNWIKDGVRYHTANMSSVKPEVKFCSKDNAIYLNSCAGLIKFTSRDVKEFEHFRNIFSNRFSQLEENKDFFSLYTEIFDFNWKKSRVKYKANLRTRLRMKVAG